MLIGKAWREIRMKWLKAALGAPCNSCGNAEALCERHKLKTHIDS